MYRFGSYRLAHHRLASSSPAAKATSSTQKLPFLYTGVDLCGPTHYRQSHRKAQLIKSFVAIFICMAVKAVHIALVADLSVMHFLPHFDVLSHGEENLLSSNVTTPGTFWALPQSSVITPCIDDDIKFKFPPRSPNFGGLWEAAVKSFKAHFKPTIRNAVLTSEELNTLLIQIEGCMNSPLTLTPLSNEPSDLEVLPAVHFLIHRPIVYLAEQSLKELPFNHLDRWQRLQEYLRRFWKRWPTD
uniref:Uncharacterized protein n=1 Tax=Anopheles funestus TaxID=62324 RepID=A0A4Y0BEY9_ANOFN